jgi:hypothetical protein
MSLAQAHRDPRRVPHHNKISGLALATMRIDPRHLPMPGQFSIGWAQGAKFCEEIRGIEYSLHFFSGKIYEAQV